MLAHLPCVQFYCSRVDAVHMHNSSNSQCWLPGGLFLITVTSPESIKLLASYIRELPIHSNFSLPVFPFFPTMSLGMGFCTFCSKLVTSRCVCMRVQSCPTLWDPVDYSPSGSSPYGVFQARILVRVAISFFRGYSQLRYRIPRLLASPACIDSQVLYQLSHQEVVTSSRAAKLFAFMASPYLGQICCPAVWGQKRPITKVIQLFLLGTWWRMAERSLILLDFPSIMYISVL